MSDLIIGTRRPSQARSLRSLVLVVVLLVVATLLAYFFYRRVASYDHPSGKVPKGVIHMDPDVPGRGMLYDKASLRYLGRLALLRLEGSAHELGAQHGRLLATPVDELQDIQQANIESSVSKDGLFGSRLHNIRLRWRWRSLDDGIPGHQLVELAGLVRGAKKSGRQISYEDAVRQSALFDIGTPAPGSAGAELWHTARSLSMVAPINNESEKRLLIGRSLSLPGLSDGGQGARKHPVVQIVHPDDALAFASLSWPGMVGVLSGINREGIGVFVHPLKTKDVRITRQAQPTPLLARQVLEHSHDLAEATNILKEAEPLGAAVFVVVDGKSGEWAAIERSPSTLKVRKAPSPPVVVDTLEAAEFAEDPLIDRSRRSRPFLARKARAAKLLRKPLASPAALVELLRDRSSADGTRLPLGHRSAIDDTESAHTAIFDVSGLVLWVSDSGDSAGRFRAIDLRYELRGEGDAPVPPKDIPAANAEEGERVAVRAARQKLILARRLAADDHLSRARELASSALARAPSLPEALLVAGQLAQEDDDELAARPLLHRFLELSPDDLRAKEQVEAWLGTGDTL